MAQQVGVLAAEVRRHPVDEALRPVHFDMQHLLGGFNEDTYECLEMFEALVKEKLIHSTGSHDIPIVQASDNESIDIGSRIVIPQCKIFIN